ncbi:HEPN domain-containing protein [Agriterribacter sp.]|uniref:HEPN domain-containing protein n=1 Tax=Agriterribacter sp. TaxID=2821509 RepID=UPI002CBF0FB6|nr:HEPN domain-containing protein [Agriterribacter sp.]HRP58061.1 HEPN domain-containing protein [Agriterribacter sp.]
MPYSRSRARQEFENKSVELVSLARQISYKNVALSYEHKNLIFQSTIVLLCSSLEEYLRVFIEDLFFNYKSLSATISEIPVNPRTFSLFHKQRTIYEGFINNRDEFKILDRLNITNQRLYSVVDSTQTFVDHIDSKMIVNDKKYPSPKNLKILFNRIGIKSIFNETDRIGKKNYELLLRSFLDVRETIAHQESTDLTFNDVKRNFKNITDLLDKLDRASYSHICSISGQKYW